MSIFTDEPFSMPESWYGKPEALTGDLCPDCKRACDRDEWGRLWCLFCEKLKANWGE